MTTEISVKLYVSRCQGCDKRIYRYPDGYDVGDGLPPRDGEWFHFDSYKNCHSGRSVRLAVPDEPVGVETQVTKRIWDAWS